MSTKGKTAAAAAAADPKVADDITRLFECNRTITMNCASSAKNSINV